MSWTATLIQSNNTSEQFFSSNCWWVIRMSKACSIYRSKEFYLNKINTYNIGNLNKVKTTLNMQTELICKKQNVLANNIARDENVWVS